MGRTGFFKVASVVGLLMFTSIARAASVQPYLRLVIAGDSIGAGNIVGADPWSDLQLVNGYEVKNHSVSGSYLGQHASINGYETAELADFTAQYGAGNSWLVIQAGTNDLAQGAPSEALYRDNTVKMIRDARARGFRILVATILPRNNSNFAWDQDKERQRLDYNSLVRANSGGADAIADLALDPTIGSTAKTYDSTLFADGLHPTGLAYLKYIEPVYTRALNAAAAAAPTSTPISTPAPAPVATPAPLPVPAPSSAVTGGGTVFPSTNASLSALVGQKAVSIDIHINAIPLDSPFYTTCLSLVNSNGRYVDQSGACFNPPQRSDVATGDEHFTVDLSLRPDLAEGKYAVVFSYMRYTGTGWRRAPFTMASGVNISPESGNADPNQYWIATIAIGAASVSQATSNPQAPANSAPQSTGDTPTVTAGLIAYQSSTSQLRAVKGQSEVAVDIQYNAKPMASPFYAPCLSLVDASGSYVGQSGACFKPPQRSDIAIGRQSSAEQFRIPPNLAVGTYTIVLSYMQWTGAGWQRAPMAMGTGVTRSPELGNVDPNQYSIATLNVYQN